MAHEARVGFLARQKFDERKTYFSFDIPTSRLRRHGRRPAFPGIIEIQAPMRALEAAYREHLAPQKSDRLVLWTDGSRYSFAVVYRKTEADGSWGPWTALGFHVKAKTTTSGQNEALGILKAVDLARKKVKESPSQWKKVAVYTDCQSNLNAIGRADGRHNPIVDHIVRKAMALRRYGAELSLHWCPSHSDVPGNEIADHVAARANRRERVVEVLDDDETDGDATDDD